MDFGAGYGDQLLWIFTLGDPKRDLMDMLGEWTLGGAMGWVVVPVPRAEGLTSLRPNSETELFMGM